MVRVYADTNVYGRPFDGQNQLRILLEAEAALAIFQLAEYKKIELIGSDILLAEASKATIFKRAEIAPLLQRCTRHVGLSSKVARLAQSIAETTQLPARDSLHLASALSARAHYFVTCDEDFLKPSLQERFLKIRIINPTQFPTLSLL